MAEQGVMGNDPFIGGSQTMPMEDFDSIVSRGLGAPEETAPIDDAVAEAEAEAKPDVAAEAVDAGDTEIDTGEEAEELAPVEVEDDAQGKADIAENKRLRKANREKEAEKVALAERVAKLEGRIEERDSKGGEKSVSEQIASATDSELVSAKQALELEMFDAMQEADKTRYQRAVEGKAMVESQQQVRTQPQVADTVPEAKAQFLEVHDSLQEKYPEALDPESAFGQEVKVFAEKNKALMTNLGPLGELFAVASVIGLKPELLKGRKAALVTERVETGIKQVVQNAVSKGRTRTATKQGGVHVPTTVNAVNEMIEKIKSGAVSLDQLQ